MSIRSVVLVGAGGNLGPGILTALRQEGFEVTVLSRSSSEKTFPPEVRVVKIDDYQSEELVEALKGHDAVVTTASTIQKRLYDASIAAGVKHFIPSEFGSDNRSVEAREMVPMWQHKYNVISYLKSKESSGVAWTAIINSPFFDWAFNVTKGSFFKIDVENRQAVVLDDGNHRWSTSNLEQVGRAVAKVLTKPDLFKNKYVLIESFSVTQNQILDGLERGLDIKFERHHVDGKKWLKEQSEQGKAGDKTAAYSAIIGWSMLDESFADKEDYGNKILNLPLEDFQTSLDKVLHNFRK